MASSSHRTTAAAALDEDDEEVWLSVATTTTNKTIDPTTTTSSLPKGLLDLERELRCPICKDFFHNPVSIVPCHHTFCSECIRTYFTGQIKSLVRKARCAACKCDVDTKNDKCYIPNRSVQRLVGIFAQRVRDPLLHVLRDGGGEDMMRNDDDPLLLDSKQPRRTRSADHQPALDVEELPPTNASCSLADPSHHQQPTEVTKLRNKRSKPHYASKSKAQLKKLCRDEGLSIAGTEVELRQRHTDFIVLYNSECDSYTPRSVQELVDIIHAREHARAQQKRTMSFAGNKHHDITKLQLGDKNLAAGFQKMIQDLKEKKRKQKEAGSTSGAEEEPKDTTSAGLAETNSATTNDADDNMMLTEMHPELPFQPDPREPASPPIRRNSAYQQSADLATTSRAASTSGITTTTRTEPSPAPHVTQLTASSPLPPAPPLPPPTVLTTSSATADAASPNSNGSSSSSSSKRKSPLGQSHLNFDKRPRNNATGPSKRASSSSTRPMMIPSWTCDRCTFVNPAKQHQQLTTSSRPARTIPKCEMCETPRRSSSTSEQAIEVG